MTSGSRFSMAPSGAPRTVAPAFGVSPSPLAAEESRAILSDRWWLRVALALFFAVLSLLREGVAFDSPAATIAAFLHQPLSGDLMGLLAPFQASPLRLLITRCTDYADASRVLVAFHVLARFACALAILRLGERIAGSRAAGVLAALLWCGCSAASLGFAAPHDALPAQGAFALACALWAIALWSSARPEWGFLCGLVMCADAPVGIVLFLVLLGLIWWTPQDAASAVAGWRGAAHEARRRAARCSGAFCWWLLAAVPLAAFLAPSLRAATKLLFSAAAPDAWHAVAAYFAAFLRLQSDPVRTPQFTLWFPVAALLGLWCWRRAARSLPAARAVFGVAMVASLLSLGAMFMLEVAPLSTSNAAFGWRVAARLAPLAVSLALIGVAHSLQRLAARQGARGLTLSLGIALAFCALPGPSWLWLACGLALAALVQRGARRTSWNTSPRVLAALWTRMRVALEAKWSSSSAAAMPAAPRWRAAREAASMQRSARLVLLALFAITIWQARSAALHRLENNSRVLANLPDANWLAAQRFAREKTPRRALFLAQENGFRAFSRRAVWVERADKNLLAPFPVFARRRNARLALAAPLWNESAPGTSWLRAIKKRGVTHLVLRREARPPRVLALRKLYENAHFAIYQLR